MAVAGGTLKLKCNFSRVSSYLCFSAVAAAWFANKMQSRVSQKQIWCWLEPLKLGYFCTEC